MKTKNKYDIHSEENRQVHEIIFSDLTIYEYNDISESFKENFFWNWKNLNKCNTISDVLIIMLFVYPITKYKLWKFKKKYPEYLL